MTAGGPEKICPRCPGGTGTRFCTPRVACHYGGGADDFLLVHELGPVKVTLARSPVLRRESSSLHGYSGKKTVQPPPPAESEKQA